jgi:hypothetical protein
MHPDLLPPRPNSVVGPSSSSAEAGENEAGEAPLTGDLEPRRRGDGGGAPLPASVHSRASPPPAYHHVRPRTGGRRASKLMVTDGSEAEEGCLGEETSPRRCLERQRCSTTMT